MTELSSYLAPSGQLKEMLHEVRNEKKVSAFGMQFYNRVLCAALVGKGVYVCADFVSARAAYEELKDLTDCLLLPPKDDVLTYRKSQSGENAAARLYAMSAAVAGKEKLIVTTADALCQLFPLREAFAAHFITIERGKSYDLFKLVSGLAAAGYRREAQVTAPGQFSLRGDILDVWAIGKYEGYRAEFFGDEVESLRRFDIGEQVGLGDEEKAVITPSTDLFLNGVEAENVCAALKKDLAKMKRTDESYGRAEAIASEIASRLSAGDRDKALGVILPLTQCETFFDFFCPSVVFYDDAKAVFDAVSVTYSEHESRYKMLLERGEVLPGAVKQLMEKEKVFSSAAAKSGQLAFHRLNSQNRIFQPQAVYHYNTVALPDYAKSYGELIDDVRLWQEQGYKITLFAQNEPLKQSLSDLFSEHNVGFCCDGSGAVTLSSAPLGHGAVFFEQKTVLIGTFDVTHKNPKKQLRRNKKDVFVEPEVGDYVVHSVHGIGLCEQITRLEMGGAARDYVVVRYEGGDKLYVPIENMDSLSKLVAGEEHPKLSKIGGADFARIKEKVKNSVKTMAINLLELYAQRSKSEGYRYDADDALFDEFSADFAYTETEDQLTAIAEGLQDLKEGKVMDRLLCGDVGYGKTEVALRLAFKVIAEGKQVAFLSPTTILARQHYNTVVRRMQKFGVKVGSLTRFDSAEQTKHTLLGLADGLVDIVCGTHRILSKDVAFKDLGMLILDEEQRFGVADKEKIKLLKKNVNVLSLSATPIPRTLHMSMVGIRDVSVLDMPPADRIPVQTYVTEYSETLVADAINREVNRGGQVFIVFNRVAEIDAFAASVQRLVPELKVAVGHGQMGEGALERVIATFVSGDSDVLVASTIIENGIDMPRANTMLVVDADRLGLSQLYQLRGRVGRSNRLAYVYFTFDGRKILTETAYKRLDAITQFTEFGSGFKIAMRDLEIRGAGNILGREQHGHIEKVGYDLYCKLLSQAVDELKGIHAAPELREIKVLTDFNAFIPETYVTDNEWRLRLYTKISRLKTDEERLKLMADLNEIYGKVPDSASNLLTIGLVKNLALMLGCSGVTLKKTGGALTFPKMLDVPESAICALNLFKGASVAPTLPGITFTGAEGGRSLVKFLLVAAKK